MTTMPACLSGLLPLLDELRALRLPPPPKRRAIRLAAKVSQQKLADTLGVSQRNISNWERGFVEPTPAYALAYRVALEYLEQLALEQGAADQSQK